MKNESGLTLIAELGRGGMADVFLAMRRGFGGFAKLVVVKRLRHSVDHDMISMFADEAKLAARLNHPNVVQTFHADEDQLEMEFLDGQAFSRVIKRAKKLGRTIDLDLALVVIKDVLAALSYAHDLKDFDGKALNVVHRDVSPQNVFLTYDGKVKLIDFGIAKSADQDELTKIGVVKGKVTFMAPEQAAGSFVDRRVDIFATGILLWELLTGQRYWGKASEAEIVRRLRTGDLPSSPRSVNPDISSELASICSRALSFDREERFATAGEFLSALEAAAPTQATVRARLGELVVSLFGEDRQKINAVIEQAIARGKAAPKFDLSELTKLTMSGAHSRSEVTALPMTRTAPPVPSQPPSKPLLTAGLAVAAVLLAVGSTLLSFTLLPSNNSVASASSSPTVLGSPRAAPSAPAPPVTSAVAADAGPVEGHPGGETP